MGLTREQILAARQDRKPQRLDVPEWGGDVFVRTLSAAEQGELAESAGDGVLDGLTRVLVASLCDEQGHRLFSDEDGAELMKEDAPVIMRVFAFAAKLNGSSTKELDEAMENFERGPEVA